MKIQIDMELNQENRGHTRMADSSVSLSVFFLHRRVGRWGRGKMRAQTCGWVMAGAGGLRKRVKGGGVMRVGVPLLEMSSISTPR